MPPVRKTQTALPTRSRTAGTTRRTARTAGSRSGASTQSASGTRRPASDDTAAGDGAARDGSARDGSAASNGSSRGRRLATQPELHQRSGEVQEFGTVREFPLALSHEARMNSCERLNRVLADSQILYSLYKKHHWLMRGATFYQLHLLLDKHAGEQLELIDSLAERVQTLGGVAVGDPRHVAELTAIPRPPDGVEEVPAMLSRLLEAHETVLADARDAASEAGDMGDDGTEDLLVSDVIRTGELQAWFLAEHLVDTPLVRS